MRLLWLNAGLLLPLDKGGKLRTWHLLRQLARRHEVTYLSFAEPGTPREAIDGMGQVCKSLFTVPRGAPAKGTARFYASAAARLLDPLPYAVGAYRSRAYRAMADRLLRTGDFDAVVCDFLVPAVNLSARLPCASVLFTHNVEAEIWRRHAETAVHPLRRALLRGQWRRMRRFEQAAVRRFDRVLAVSEGDRDTLARLYGGPRMRPISVIPTGVDTEYFAPLPGEKPRHLVFTGSMDWLPNEDAAVHFCRDILPAVRAKEPGVTVSIVGRSPTPTVRKLAAQVPGVEVTGPVDDVRPHVARASLAIVPLRIGGGTRLKIFEAMAMGRAVVSTSVGAEGLPVTPGYDVSIADGPDAFAAEVVRLLRDADARLAMGQAARATVTDRHDWRAVAGSLEQALAETVSAARDRVVAREGIPPLHRPLSSGEPS